MRGMGEVQEMFQAPPPGTYPVVVAAAEAGISGKGNSQIVVTLEIADGKYKGEQVLDWVGTDPGAKGAGIGRGKMRILLKGTQYDGLADAASSNEVPDQVIAQALVGRRLFAVIANSPRKRKDEQGNRTNEDMTQVDPATGALVTVMNADVKGYTLHATSQQQVQGQSFAQTAAQAPAQGFAAPAQTFVPAQGAQSFTQPVATQQATATAAPALPFTPNYAPGAATPPWAPQNGAAAQGQAPAECGGRKRKVNLANDAQG